MSPANRRATKQTPACERPSTDLRFRRFPGLQMRNGDDAWAGHRSLDSPTTEARIVMLEVSHVGVLSRNCECLRRRDRARGCRSGRISGGLGRRCRVKADTLRGKLRRDSFLSSYPLREHTSALALRRSCRRLVLKGCVGISSSDFEVPEGVGLHTFGVRAVNGDHTRVDRGPVSAEFFRDLRVPNHLAAG